jgi:hypothetical protein
MMHFFKAWMSARRRKANQLARAQRPPQPELLENRVALAAAHGLANGLLDAPPPQANNPYVEVRVVGNPHNDASQDSSQSHVEVRVVGNPHNDASQDSSQSSEGADAPGQAEAKASKPATAESSDQPDAAASAPEPVAKSDQVTADQNDTSPMTSPSATTPSSDNAPAGKKAVEQERSAQAPAVTDSQTSSAEAPSAPTNGSGLRTPEAPAAVAEASGRPSISEAATVRPEAALTAAQDQGGSGLQLTLALETPAAGTPPPAAASQPVDSSALSGIRPAAAVPSFTPPLPLLPQPAAVPVQAVADAEPAAPEATAPSGGGQAAAIDAALAPQGADLLTPVLPIEAFDLAADWQQVREQTRAALDRLLSLAKAAGPWSWLAGGTLLAVGAEVVRRRAARARRRRAANWPEVIPPNGLV